MSHDSLHWPNTEQTSQGQADQLMTVLVLTLATVRHGKVGALSQSSSIPATRLKPLAQSCSSKVRLGKPGAGFTDGREPNALHMASGTGLILMCCCEGATGSGSNEAGVVLA